MKKVSAEMTIAQILKCRPDAVRIFMRYGMYCIGCSIGESESLQDAADIHQISVADILRDLNKEQKN